MDDGMKGRGQMNTAESQCPPAVIDIHAKAVTSPNYHV